jgi:hypothetical protein
METHAGGSIERASSLPVPESDPSLIILSEENDCVRPFSPVCGFLSIDAIAEGAREAEGA